MNLVRDNTINLPFLVLKPIMLLKVYLLSKKPKIDAGFTLIELLVVIIIVGILSAIAIPSFLNQAGKARQTEGKLNVSSILKAQQAHFLETNKFITSIDNVGQLGLGIKPQTANYNYLLSETQSGGGVVAIANPLDNAPYKAYAGAVGLIYQSGSDSLQSQSVLCESIASGEELTATAVNVTVGSPKSGGGSVSCNSDQAQEVK